MIVSIELYSRLLALNSKSTTISVVEIYFLFHFIYLTIHCYFVLLNYVDWFRDNIYLF